MIKGVRMNYSELYQYLEDYNIGDSYAVIVDKEKNCYKIDFFDIIQYIDNYVTDDYICNLDGLCDLVESIASDYNLPILLALFKNLDYNISKNEWLCIDCVYWNITPFNNLEEMGQIFDLADVFEDMLECGMADEYCIRLAKIED